MTSPGSRKAGWRDLHYVVAAAVVVVVAVAVEQRWSWLMREGSRSCYVDHESPFEAVLLQKKVEIEVRNESRGVEKNEHVNFIN